jgi:hypothetical protein
MMPWQRGDKKVPADDLSKRLDKHRGHQSVASA